MKASTCWKWDLNCRPLECQVLMVTATPRHFPVKKWYVFWEGGDLHRLQEQVNLFTRVGHSYLTDMILARHSFLKLVAAKRRHNDASWLDVQSKQPRTHHSLNTKHIGICTKRFEVPFSKNKNTAILFWRHIHKTLIYWSQSQRVLELQSDRHPRVLSKGRRYYQQIK